MHIRYVRINKTKKSLFTHKQVVYYTSNYNNKSQ